MVNLLFDCSVKPESHLSIAKTKKSVVEIVVFTPHPKYTEQEIQNALESLNEIIKLYHGFIERTTARTAQGDYVDMLYWTDMKSAKIAAKLLVTDKKASKFFDMIMPESLQMNHYSIFNQFDE
ncbi:hypothetical protein J8281_06850 [Aquimarina sp. U1-2]|uniref:hypothetical protein n=1 Tax=Aquimarina sp. U1-2 TaxID=2823141 RepID=UPI001AED0C59|nr:hypothetical protein [Aquimarina sp. U1-2]MBP2831903.1 hypothetical protein [Aquimarina sp. U1-2]